MLLSVHEIMTWSDDKTKLIYKEPQDYDYELLNPK